MRFILTSWYEAICRKTEEKSAGNNERRPVDGNRRDNALPLRMISSGIPVKHIGLSLIGHGKIPLIFFIFTRRL
jgi:hypothetical protein